MTLDHPDYQAMLAAVLADPADDVPRLVIADWLQEQPQWRECGRCKRRSDWHDALTDDGRCLDCKGSGRVPNGYAEYAEFIRVQVELATKSDCPDWCDHDPAKCRVEALRERERTLFKDSGPRWWNHLPGNWRTTVGADISIETAEGWKYLIRRGFPEVIRCPMRAWLGEECKAVGPHHGDQCDGGRVQSPNAQFTQDCNVCHGLGTTGGIGPRLVRRCPLTKVTLSDREPVEDEYENYEIGVRGSDWGWVRRVPGDQGDRPYHLPPELFDLLDLSIHPEYSTIKTAPTRQAAIDALSDAALKLALGHETTSVVRAG